MIYFYNIQCSEIDEKCHTTKHYREIINLWLKIFLSFSFRLARCSQFYSYIQNFLFLLYIQRSCSFTEHNLRSKIVSFLLDFGQTFFEFRIFKLKTFQKVIESGQQSNVCYNNQKIYLTAPLFLRNVLRLCFFFVHCIIFSRMRDERNEHTHTHKANIIRVQYTI